jgi:glyoxylase-like metal-dependent hydrolase (beta-lactamase superfamily II)
MIQVISLLKSGEYIHGRLFAFLDVSYSNIKSMEIPHIPLEDTYADILSKAQAGLGLTDSELVHITGIDRQAIRSARRGAFVEQDACKLAKALQLDPEKLCVSARKTWYPKEISIEGLIPVTMPFPESGYDEMTVNAYIIQVPGSDEAILFDTGTRPQVILKELLDRQLKLSGIFLTHSHRDHIGGISTLLHTFQDVTVYAHTEEQVEEAYSIDNNQLFSFQSTLDITCLSTPGHSKGGISYYVKGLETNVLISGDALFAGSIGGAISSYEQALGTIKENLFTLPDDTIVCPGHGPMTSIGEEKEHNPFFPA